MLFSCFRSRVNKYYTKTAMFKSTKNTVRYSFRLHMISDNIHINARHSLPVGKTTLYDTIFYCVALSLFRLNNKQPRSINPIFRKIDVLFMYERVDLP